MSTEMAATEPNGWKERLNSAQINKEYIIIIFKYSSEGKHIKKSGYVIRTYLDSFDFNEIFDGHASYSYQYIVEIRNGKKEVSGNGS